MKKRIHQAALVLSIFLCAGALWSLSSRYTRPTSLRVIIDPMFSASMHQHIYRLISSSIFRPTADNLNDTLKLITAGKSMKARLASNGQVTVHITAYRPVLRINNDRVIVNNGDLVTATLFADYVLEGLPMVHVAPARIEVLQADINSCLHLTHLPAALFDRYELAWNTATDLWLHDRLNKHLSIRAHPSCEWSESLQTACIALAHDKKLLSKQRRHHRFIADVRFKDQIVVHQELLST